MVVLASNSRNEVKEPGNSRKDPVDYDVIKKEVIQVRHTESCLLKSTAEVGNPQVNTFRH